MRIQIASLKKNYCVHTSAICWALAIVLPRITIEKTLFSMMLVYINAIWCSAISKKVHVLLWFYTVRFWPNRLQRESIKNKHRPTNALNG